MGGRDAAAVPVDAGWACLGRGEWAAAADWFDEALARDADDARALEGRAWTAWWLDDAPLLFRTRERAFHAHRTAGDAVGAARAAIWLGSDHHEIRGDHAVANGWYQRARRLLADVPPAAEHGWLAFHDGAYAIELADDTTTARERAAEAAAIGHELGVSDLVFLGAALEGLALVTEGDVEAGMRRLDEASVAATSGELHERIAVTWTLCYLIYACERVRDFDRTTQWCKRMEEVASTFGFEGGVGICRVHYGGVLVFHGDWERAEHELQRSRAILADVRPMAVPESDARLGELRRRQGRGDEATMLFQRALPHPLAELGLAWMALDRGDASAALDRLDDLVAATPPGSVTQLADALWVLAVARARADDLDGAREAATRLDAIAEAIGNRPLAAMAAAARGAVALAAGAAADARQCFQWAATLFDRSGLPYEAAAARRDLGTALSQLEASDTTPDGAVPGLTPRETEVLALVAAGLTDREIAERLTISPHTVHRHVSNILTKLDVPSRTAAVAHGARHGIVG